MATQPQKDRGVLGFATCLALFFLLLKLFVEPYTAEGFAILREHKIEPQPGLNPKTEGVCWAPDWPPILILNYTFAAWAIMGVVANLIFKDGSRKVSLFHAISEVVLCSCWNWFCWDTSQGFINFLYLQKSPAITWIVLWGQGYFLMDLIVEFYYEEGAFLLHHVFVIVGIYHTTNLASGMVQFALWAEVGGVVFHASRQFRNTKRNRLIFLIVYIASRVPMMGIFGSAFDMVVLNPMPTVTFGTLLMVGGINAINVKFIYLNIMKYRKMKAE